MISETIQLGSLAEATLSPICITNTEELAMSPRRAVIVCPGGGYGFLSDREAEPIALPFLAAGFATFVLRYGVKENAKDYRPLKAAALAIRYVREHAKEYNVDPDYVFICGFSAGGHLAASSGVLWENPALDEVLAGAPRDIGRPTGMILSYPVITAGELAHQGSIRNLCGKENPSDEERYPFSLEKHVSKTTPPAFLWHTFNDEIVPVQNSLLMAEAMTNAGVPFELHIWPAGPHGSALCNEITACGNDRYLMPDAAEWVTLAIRWAKELKI
ncbi:MAG: alpha/beta hydrolase [Clostridia bacterium]|nr:alpha/beta hydrolase [Clostridia bacterium]